MQKLCVVQRCLVIFSIPKLAAVLYTFWGSVCWQSLNTSSGARNFWFICFVPLNLLFPSSPSSSFPSLQILSLPVLFSDLAGPEATMSCIPCTIYCVYYHPLELRSNPLVLELPVLTSVSVLYMHLCIHPLFPRPVLVSPLKLHGPHQSYQFTAFSFADI